jgi:hypothetical protein
MNLGKFRTVQDLLGSAGFTNETLFKKTKDTDWQKMQMEAKKLGENAQGS